MPYLLQPHTYGDRNLHVPWGTQRRKAAVSGHKSTPTCTVSLAHAEVVSAPFCEVSSIPEATNGSQAPQLSVHVQMQQSLASRSRASRSTPGSINFIPFPTSESLPTSISSRPLPIPPKPHALLRVTPLAPPASSPDVSLLPTLARSRVDFDVAHTTTVPSLVAATKSRVVPPPMQRRRSRDPNVADHLVVEVDDDDHQVKRESIPPRPCSPTPEAHLQANRCCRRKTPSESDSLKSPEQSAPPAYSSLPPPYSASDYEEKKEVSESPVILGEGKATEPASVKVPLSSTRSHKPSLFSAASTSSSSSSSSNKRTRVSTSELKVLVYLYRTVVYGLEMRRQKEESAFATTEPIQEASSRTKKPLGPRSSPSFSPTLSAGALIPPPEDKSHFEIVLASATKAKQTQRGFGAFPLIEDDLDDAESDEEMDYVIPRTPFHSPSQSPRLTPLPLIRSSSFTDLASSNTAASGVNPQDKPKEKGKADINAELDVQDALLAIRLKDFLRAQGVCEDDLRVGVDDEGEGEVEKVVDEVEKVNVDEVQQEEVDEDNILDEYFMGIEEEDTTAKTERGPLVEEEEIVATKALSPFIEDERDMDLEDSSSPPAPVIPPHLQVATQSPTAETQRICSPPPPSPSPRPRAVLPSSYMVALLTMRNRHPSKKPGSNNGGGEKGKDSTVKRKSGLSVVVEVD